MGSGSSIHRDQICIVEGDDGVEHVVYSNGNENKAVRMKHASKDNIVLNSTKTMSSQMDSTFGTVDTSRLTVPSTIFTKQRPKRPKGIPDGVRENPILYY